MGHLLKAAVRSWFSVVAISFCASEVTAQKIEPETYQVGVAQIDITPDYPVRLSGFGFRRTESEGVTQRIVAGALVIDDGSDPRSVGTPAVLLSVDNCGVPAAMTAELARRLAADGVRSERLAVCATHTHTAPMLAGILPTLFGVPIPE